MTSGDSTYVIRANFKQDVYVRKDIDFCFCMAFLSAPRASYVEYLEY